MSAVPMTGGGVDGVPSRPAAGLNLKLVLWTLFIFVTSTAIRAVGDYPAQITWLLADLITVALFLRYQSQFINLALSNLVFMSWPVVACISASWSIAPALSLIHGIQLLMTILVAFLICIQIRLEQVVAVVFCALLAAAGVTLAVEMLASSPFYQADWRGSFPHKNIMGSTMSLLVITACCLFLQGRWRLVSLVAVILGLFLIAKSNSAGAILSLAMVLALLPFAYALQRGRTAFMTSLGIALLVSSVGALTLYAAMAALGIDPINIVLDAVGRERTLTGRTLLWDMAEQAIESRPWFGFGYKAYWTNVPAEMLELLRVVGGVFHFHNNYLEVAVAFGVIGPILLGLGIFTGLVRSFRRLLRATDPLDIWPLLVVSMAIALTFAENLLVWNHSLWQVLFVVASVIRK
jgi:O-antigen ligase